MSRVTNTILTFSLCEDVSEDDKDKGVIEEVNRFFGEWRGFKSVGGNALPNYWYGGTKRFETNIYLGAFNYLDLDGLIAHLKSIKWERPDLVQLMVKEEDDELFRIIRLQEESNEPRD